MEEAIILCGGRGVRLKPLTDNLPKAMVDVKDKPLIDWQIEWLKKYNVSKIVLACGYLYEKIKKHLGNDFIYSVEKKPLGTAGALKSALNNIDRKEFLVLNVDDLTDVNIDKLRKMGSNTICLGNLKCNYGVVHTQGDKVIGFQEKPVLKDIWVSMGIYVLNRDIELPNNGSLEHDVFPKLELKAYKHTGFWKTINTIKDIEEFDING